VFENGKVWMKGFDAYYEAELKNIEASIERSRLAALAEFKRRAVISVPAAAVLSAPAFYLLGPLGLIALGALLYAAYKYYVSLPAKEFEETMENDAYASISTFFGLEYEAEPTLSSLRNYSGTNTLPPHDRSQYKNGRTGSYQNVLVSIIHAHLEQFDKKDKDYDTRFKGTLRCFSFPKSFAGTTIIHPDRSALGNRLSKSKSSLSRIRIEDQEFEQYFVVLGSDQVESRYILSPDFITRFMKLMDILGPDFTVKFEDSMMMIYYSDQTEIESSPFSIAELDYFMGNIDAKKLVGNMIHDTSVIFEIIETLNLTSTTKAS